MPKGKPQKKEEGLKLNEFIEEFREELLAKVVAGYPPLYRPEENRDKYRAMLSDLKRKPFPAQLDTVGAVATILQKEQSAVIVGEMGCGKTFLGIATSQAIKAKTVLVCCPPHLVKKWEREIRMTVDPVDVVQLRTLSDAMKTRAYHFSKGVKRTRPLFCVVSRERAKLGYGWRPSANKRIVRGEGEVEFEKKDRRGLTLKQRVLRIPQLTVFQCPTCGEKIVNDDGIYLSWVDLSKKKMKCRKCHGPLWQADEKGVRRYAISEYIKRFLPKAFDLFVLDESHEAKGRNTAQGISAGVMSSASKKTVALIGTLFGGYSRTLFYILHRFTHGFHKDFHYEEEWKWINLYGIVEKITKIKGNEDLDDNVMSRGKKGSTTIREKPGISPVILPKYLLGRCVFLRLADMSIALPKYNEYIVSLEMDPDHREAYNKFQNDLITELRKALRHGDKSMLSKYLQALLCYPEQPWNGEVVKNKTNEIVAVARSLPEDRTYPKEQELIDIIKEGKRQGRKVLVYCTHTDRRDVTARINQKLSAEGIRCEVLTAAVEAEKREDWIAARTQGIDVLITNPKLVQTGLDLLNFQTFIFDEIEYSVYVLRQASRRGWRIGQTKPVKVYFLVYTETIQEKGLKLIAQKFKTSLAIEGELMDDGLATYHAESGDLYYDLARSIVDGVESVPGSLDDIWAKVREQEIEILGLPPAEVNPVEDLPFEVDEVAPQELPAFAPAPVPGNVRNELYDALWQKMKEEKAPKGQEKEEGR